MSIERLARPQPRWITPFARMGYGARGIIYLVIAGFALTSALWGGETEDTRGALETILASGPGTIVAIVLAVSLLGYAAWRFVQSIFDTDDHRTSAKGLAVRGGLLVSGISYGLLALYVLSLWRGTAASGESGSAGSFATMFASVVGSRIVAYAIAAMFAGAGIAHIWKAAKKGYRRHIQPPPRLAGLLDHVAVTGLGARGTVFLILALLMLTRGLSAGDDGGGDPPGIQEALAYIVGLPMGRLLLGAMAVGLAAFALYSLAEALWRRINVEDA